MRKEQRSGRQRKEEGKKAAQGRRERGGEQTGGGAGGVVRARGVGPQEGGDYHPSSAPKCSNVLLTLVPITGNLTEAQVIEG